METNKKMKTENDSDILFSRSVKAGQRIYYIDVKQNRKGEMYVSITESKKVQTGTAEMPHASYEKHKIFIFREDFAKFGEALADAVSYVNNEQGPAEDRAESGDAIKLDLDF